jgi:hypothetical protein
MGRVRRTHRRGEKYVQNFSRDIQKEEIASEA